MYFAGYVAGCIYIGLCASFVVDVSVARTGFVAKPVLATDTSTTKGAHNLIWAHNLI